MHEFAFIFAGFAVGLVVGLTGVGGGSLMTPLLIFVFGIKPHLAIGTDLLFAAFTKMGGTISLARARVIDWRIVGQVAAGSIPATLVTLFVLQRLGPADPATQSVMTTTLGVALLLTAVATLYKALRGKAAPTRIAPELLDQATRARHWALPVLFGAVIGALVTLTSVGAGAIGGDAPETIKAPGRAYAINGFPTSEEWKWPRPHIDHAIKEHGHKTFPRAFRIAAMTFLSDVAPHGGGTIVWPGSHAVLERLAKSDPVRYETMWALNQDLATAPLTLASSDPVQVYELLRGQSRRGHRRAQGTQDPEAKGKGKGF